MSDIDLLVAVKPQDQARYHQNLTNFDDFTIELVGSTADALEILQDRYRHTDVLVIDNHLDSDVFGLVGDLRLRYPRLLIVLVDEEADFAMPGQADDISTEPFRNDDLVRRISRLVADRRQETLRSDSMPVIRQFVKRLRTATGVLGKLEVAVQACQEMGFDYVGYYGPDSASPDRLMLKAQVGTAPIKASAPKEAAPDDLMTWVAQNGQSRIAAPEDRPNHPLVMRGRLGAIACIPAIFNGTTYGVLVACRERPTSITQEHVLMLELISAQLAAAISRETGTLNK